MPETQKGSTIPSTFESGLGRERVGGGSAWRLLLFSLFVFTLLFVAYIGLRLGYRPFLESRIEEKEKQLADLVGRVSEQEQKTLTNFYFQLVNLKDILDNHVVGSKVLPLVEKFTHQKVRYASFAVNVETKSVNFNAVAESPDVFVQQIEAYRRFKEVAAYKLSAVSIGENNVINFGADLTLAAEVFK